MSTPKTTAIIVHGAYFLPSASDAFNDQLSQPHSYGGIVASEATSPDLYSDASKTSSKGISSIIYIPAWLVPPGSSVPFVIEKYGFKCQVDLGVNEDGTVFAKNAPHSFYNDIHAE
ncbi:uncharacterized protein LDX57_011347 [Aspergillus melleus]|uniref:uncharacterized protein n=1 Tax=Aspergillus melleus TaxID=138277 RepID=UPI001E8CF7A2|nr:uncharacterized protein LDX57_011347 [Aspergillus melleus]KAH8433713.1 hypothetical protein LDX57_011347 [Aspergillus melleus]